MNKFLTKNYGLFGTVPEKEGRLTKGVRSFFANPLMHFVLFGIIMCVIGYLSSNKIIPDILPYSVQSSLASTFGYAIAAVGYCLLMGYSGLASLGMGGFIGIGCYAVHFVMGEAELSFWLAFLAAMGVGLVIGVIVGFISLRIEGLYLCILTLGLSEILRNLFVAIEDSIRIRNWDLFGIEIGRSESIYVVTVFLVIIMILTHNLINSPTGRAMLAMKNSTAASQAMGISLMKYRLMAFIFCTAYAVLSGMMLMLTVRSAIASNSAGFYGLITSLNILAAVIIGGFRSIWGSVFGTFVMYGMQTTLLNRIEFLQENPEFITLISGFLVIIVVMFYPGGLAQLLLEAKYKFKALKRKWREDKYGKDLG